MLSSARRALALAASLALSLTPFATPAALAQQPPAQPANPVPGLTAARAVVVSNPLQWKPCEEIFECATLTVPLDYSGRVPGTTQLAIVRLPASDPARRIGSLVINPGGPGSSATEFLTLTEGRFVSDEVRARFDIVAIDPRGIGQSTPLRCGLDELGLHPAILDAGDPRDDEEWAKMLEVAQAIATACGENAGPILPFMGTHEFTIDLEMLRIALGEPKLSFLMYSYGTQVGAQFADRFPQSVRAMVIDSAVNLNLSGPEEALQQARGREEVFNNFLEQCSLTRACAFYSDGLPAAAWDAMLADLEAAETMDSNDDSLPLTRLLRNLGYLTKEQSRWGLVAQILATVRDGDMERLTTLYEAANSSDSVADDPEDPELEEDHMDNPTDAMEFTAVECLDWQWPRSPEAFREVAIRVRTEASPRLLGGVGSWLPCLYWPAEPTLKPAPMVGRGAPPILVIGNTFDEATPYQWSVAIAGQLESARLLTRMGIGHIGMGKSDCVDILVTNYLVDLTAPVSGAVCPSNPVGTTWYVPPELR